LVRVLSNYIFNPQLLEEHALTDDTLTFDEDPLQAMSILLHSYLSVISFVRQNTDDSQFVNSAHLELAEVVMTEVISDLCDLVSITILASLFHLHCMFTTTNILQQCLYDCKCYYMDAT
jgi:hypothetical protein